jgi:hypothetical protein
MGRIEDPDLYLAGALARRPTGANGSAFAMTLSYPCNASHEGKPSRYRDCSIMPQANGRTAAPTDLIWCCGDPSKENETVSFHFIFSFGENAGSHPAGSSPSKQEREQWR